MSKKELGDSNLEWDLLFDTKRIVKEIDDPDELLSELKKKKAGIKRHPEVTDRWHGFAEELIDAEIDRLRTEINRPEFKKLKEGGRGNWKKAEIIQPEPEFWTKAQELYQEHGKKCISQRYSQYPSDWMKGKLMDMKLIGYKRQDENKENPITLKSKKIRELLGENNPKWKIRK